MRRTSSPPSLTTLILLAGTSTMTLNLIVPSLTNIARDLDADYAVISLALGGYLAVTALVELGIGPLSDRVGRRPVLLIALAVFAGASLGCAMAGDDWTFLAFRMLQAGVISGCALSLAIVRDTRDGPDVVRVLGKIAMAMALAPMLGPMVGSVLDAAFGWRAIFLLYAAVGAGLLCLVWVDLGETVSSREPAGGDGSRGVSGLLRQPLFWCYALCATFSTGAFYIFLAGAPLIASSVFGVTTAGLGVFVGSITAGFIAGSYVSGRLAGRWAATTVMLAGRIVACAGMAIGLAILATGMVAPLLFFGCTIFVGVGNGLTMPNCNAGAMSVVPRLSGSAAGVSGALTLAGGALLTTLAGAALANHPSPALLLAMMLAASFSALLATVGAMRLEATRSRMPAC